MVPRVDELLRYVHDFVRFVPTAVYFNDQKISRGKFSDIENRENLKEISTGTQEWQDSAIVIKGRLYENRGHSLVASIEALTIGGESLNLIGRLRFESGPIGVFKRRFKLCATQIGSTIGVSGRLDCDRFVPTAGRDSLDAPTTILLGRIVQALEKVAVKAALETPERITQHTRIFRYVIQHHLVVKLDNVKVNLADGSECTLGDIGRRAEQGGVGVYFGVAQKQALNPIIQVRGHVVVLLSSDRFRLNAERIFLEKYCGAKAFDRMIVCAEYYSDLTRIQRVFLSELELNVSKSYELKNFRVVPGKLKEDIPVFVKEHACNQPLDIFVDVRLQEIAKLEGLGYTQPLYSLISTFCRECIGPSLKKWSPRFFGDFALNLELLAKRRSELWIPLEDGIGVVRKGGKRQVVTRSDVQVVNVGGSGQRHSEPEREEPPSRILRIIDEQGNTGLAGFYIRLPDTALSKMPRPAAILPPPLLTRLGRGISDQG